MGYKECFASFFFFNRENKLILAVPLVEGRVLGGTEVWLDGLEVSEQLLGLLVVDGRSNDDILSLRPVGRSGDSLVVGELEGVEHSDDLIKVPSTRSRVDEHQTDLLFWVDDEDAPHSERKCGLLLGVVELSKHSILSGDLSGGVGNDWVVHLCVVYLLNVLLPSFLNFGVISKKSLLFFFYPW